MTEGDYPTDGYKYLPAQRVIELLQQVPPDARVICNRTTRNLTILNEDGSCWMIDFIGDGELDKFDGS